MISEREEILAALHDALVETGSALLEQEPPAHAPVNGDVLNLHDGLPLPMPPAFGADFSLELTELDLALAETAAPAAVQAAAVQAAVPTAVAGAVVVQPAFHARAETALVPTKRPEALALEPETTPAPSLELASVPEAEAAPQEKHVVFSIAGAKYGVPMSQVLEVCELNRFTPVPNVPEWVVGVVNLRGDIISIVDMRMLARLEQDDFTSQRHLIVAQTVEEDLTTCLMVEDVLGLANVETPKIQTIDRLIGDGLTPYTRGVYSQSNELLSILNLEGLLRSLEIAA